VRCGAEAPCVIRVNARLEDGTPFPTTWWLTCPWLVEAVGALESAGACAEWTARIAADVDLAAAVLYADRAYRHARAVLAGGEDPSHGRGVAGQADPLTVKCLHARVAAALAGNPDPVGRAVLARLCGADAVLCPDPHAATCSGADR
jgi:hypothetical protein